MTEDLEMKLNVWRELAISKQIMMRAATDALKLDPEVSQADLKHALEDAISRSAQADAKVARIQDEAKNTILAMEKRLAENQKSLAIAVADHTGALETEKKLQQKIIDGRESAAREVNELKQRLMEKERALKAVNTMLSDTPENVVKALKALKRQKLEESNARKQAENDAATLRNKNRQLEQTLKELQVAQESAMQMAARYRELHALCELQRDQLEPLFEDKESLVVVPMLDQDLLESVEQAGAREEKKAGHKR